jgi:hypothetical protein
MFEDIDWIRPAPERVYSWALINTGFLFVEYLATFAAAREYTLEGNDVRK